MKKGKDPVKNIKICVADDHHFVRDAMVTLIETFPRIEKVYAVADGLQLIESIPSQKPDVILLDIMMPNMNGIDASEIILSKYNAVKILILTMSDDREVMINLIKMGVHGYLTKSAQVDVVEKAIYQVVDQGYFYADDVTKAIVDNMRIEDFLRPSTLKGKMEMTHLTVREMEIVKLMCNELENEAIARQLDISLKTLQTHKQNIYRKTGAKSLISLFRFATKAGLIQP